MKHLVLLVCLFLSLSSCDQKGKHEYSSYIIDETIAKEVEEIIKETEITSFAHDKVLLYENIVIADIYVKGSLANSAKYQKMPFKSFFYAQNDTISIDGGYGLFGSFGFSIKLIDDKAIVYHMLAGDDFPTYSITKDGELKYRIEVPCTNTKLILSKIPELKEKDIIYGIVEFDSGEYYHVGATVGGKEIEERKRMKMDMKVYFMSKYLEIEE